MRFLLGLLLLSFPVFAAPDSLFLDVSAPRAEDTIRAETFLVQGKAHPGSVITIRTESVTADSAGLFQINLTSPPAAGRYPLAILAQWKGQSTSATIPFVKVNPVVLGGMATGLMPPARLTIADSSYGTDSVDVPLFSGDSNALRVAVFLPDAPSFSTRQLQTFINRFKQDLQTTATNIKLDFVSLESLKTSKVPVKLCRDALCAVQLGRENGLDIVVTSQLQRKGSGYHFEASALSVLASGSLATVVSELNSSLTELEQVRLPLAEGLTKTMQKTLKERGLDQLRASGMNMGTVIDQSILSGVLTLKKSPYLIYGNIIVPAGEVLEIEPGVTLLFVPGQNAGFSIFGQIRAEGTAAEPIRFISAAKQPNAWDWNRILIAGVGRSVMQHVEIAYSNYGLHVENSGLAIQNSHIHHNSLRGIYARNAQVDIQNVTIDGGQLVGVQVAALSSVKIARSTFKDNRVGIATMSQGQLELVSNKLTHNDQALLLVDGGSLVTVLNRIENNEVGLVTSVDVSPELFAGIQNNTVNIQQFPKGSKDAILEEPVTQEVDRTPVLKEAAVQIGEQREAERWNTYGNFQLTGGYTRVNTARNQGPLQDEMSHDIVAPGAVYPNLFTTDGGWSKGAAYVVMESDQDRGIELQMEGQADRWVKARAKPVTLRYWSPTQNFAVGNLQESASPIFLSGLQVLGAKYQFNLGRNSAGAPKFSADGFYGETRQSFASGDRNLDLFPEHYEDGAAISQQLTGFGRATFSPWGNFKMQAGGIASRDRTQNLLLRDDLASTDQLRDPMSDSRAAFAAAQWNTASGAFQLNADVAIGRADTSDVFYQAALDQAFTEAGIPLVALSDVRKVFLSDANLQDGDSATLNQILPNDNLTLTELRDSLVILRHRAMDIQSTIQTVDKADRTAGLDWTRENVASRLEMAWNYSTGNVRLSAQSIGNRYFSPGAASLLPNSREFTADLSQSVMPFWELQARYDLAIENAANPQSGAANLLGLGEGTKWGLQQDQTWSDLHLMDVNRAKVTHSANLDQRFLIGSNWDLGVGYHIERSAQHLPTKLKADYSAQSGVYMDPWFAASSNAPQTSVDRGYEDSAQVDSVRWANYMAFADMDSIAWGFSDIRFKHGLSAEVLYRRTRYTLKIGGEWTWQIDQSAFNRNDLVQEFHFEDTTWQKLGYNPETQSWFEQSYPISLSLSLGKFTNKSTFKPRWKYLAKANVHEFEYRITERVEVPMLKRKLIVSLIGDVDRKISLQDVAHYYAQNRTDSVLYTYVHDDNGNLLPTLNPIATDLTLQGGENLGGDYRVIKRIEQDRVAQWDLSLETVLRFNVTSHLYTELNGKVVDVRRPQSLGEQHRDFTGGLTGFYSF